MSMNKLIFVLNKTLSVGGENPTGISHFPKNQFVWDNGEIFFL
jgi:hypothetical protein